MKRNSLPRTRTLGTLAKKRAPERSRWKNPPEVESLLKVRSFEPCPEIDRTADPLRGPTFKDKGNPYNFGPFSILLIPVVYGIHPVPRDAMLARFPIIAAAVSIETGVQLTLPAEEMHRWDIMHHCWQELWHALRSPRRVMSNEVRKELLRIFVPFLWDDIHEPILNMTEFDTAAAQIGLLKWAGFPEFSREPGGTMSALKPPVTTSARTRLLRPLPPRMRADLRRLAKEAQRFMPDLARHASLAEAAAVRRLKGEA